MSAHQQQQLHTNKTRNGGWYDSILDLIVFGGFPLTVPRRLLSDHHHSGALALFVIRATHWQQGSGLLWQRKFAAQSGSTINSSNAVLVDSAARMWTEGVSRIVQRAAEENGAAEKEGNTDDGDDNDDEFSDAAAVPVFGTDRQRRSYLAEDGVTVKVFELLTSGDEVMKTDDDGKNSSNAASAQQNARRNVSAVVSLIVDGIHHSRLAKEVFGANAAATTAILSTLGLCTEQQQQQQGNHGRSVIPSTVNGLLWTTLGSLKLQRCVLLQCALLHVLKKNGVKVEVDETTDCWRCSNQHQHQHHNYDEDPAHKSDDDDGRPIDKVAAAIASVFSAFFALCALDEDAWYLFPAAGGSLEAGMLAVLALLGFVSLRRAGTNGQTGVFRVMPELRDAALARGAVDLEGGAVLGGSNRNASHHVGTNQRRHQVATTDCVVVETNFRVYVHLVPVVNERTGARYVSHQGETLLAVLRTFLEPEEMVLPVFAVFRLTRDSYLRALGNGLTTEAIIRFLEAKAHPMAVAHYSSATQQQQHGGAAGAATGVPKALKDQMLSWGREADRISLKRNHILLTFPSSVLSGKMLKLLAQRMGLLQQQQDSDEPTQEQLVALLQPSVHMHNPFQIVIPEKVWLLVSDVLPFS